MVNFENGEQKPGGMSQFRSALKDIEIAEQLFRGCAEDLTRLQDSLRKGEVSEVKNAVRAARELRSATQLMLEERNRVERLRKKIAGDAGSCGFDLEAARNEIGRRLACLRRARGG